MDASCKLGAFWKELVLYHDLDQYTHYMMHDFVSHCYHGPVIFPVVFPDSVEGGNYSIH